MNKNKFPKINWIQQILRAIAIFLGIIVVVFFSIFLSILWPKCNKEYLMEKASPNSKWKAVVYAKECGATTAWGTSVNVESNNEIMHWLWHERVFSAKTHGGIDITWTSDNELTISHNVPEENIYKQEIGFKNINIRYKNP